MGSRVIVMVPQLYNERVTEDPGSRLEALRAACIEAALQAYEDAGVQGLCAEGRREAALAAIRRLEAQQASATGHPPNVPGRR